MGKNKYLKVGHTIAIPTKDPEAALRVSLHIWKKKKRGKQNHIVLAAQPQPNQKGKHTHKHKPVNRVRLN